MRKTIFALPLAAAAAFATPALAQEAYVAPDYVAVPAGAVTGTVVGLGLYNAWWGSTAAVGGAAIPTTAVGSAAVGGVAGIGTVALIDAAIQPCRGFQAMFGFNREYCAAQNGMLPRQRVARVSNRTIQR